MEQHDVIIIGGGAAGLAAGLQLGRVRRSVVVVDGGAPRNAPAAHLHGYLGLDGAAPAELLARGREEVTSYGGAVTAGRVVGVTGSVVDGFTVALSDGRGLLGRRVIVATGITDLLPGIPGVAEQWGSGVVHCPFCHGWEARDRRVVVLDTEGVGAHQALLFSQLSNDVTLVVHAGPGPDSGACAQLATAGVEVVHVPVAEVVVADDAITGVRLAGGELVAADVVVVGPPFRPNLTGLESLGLDLAEHPSGLGATVVVDATGATSVAGVYAVGNVTDPSQQLMQAAAQGSRTAGLLSFDLVRDDLATAGRSDADARDWDERYVARGQQMWSGAPNGTFVVELDGAAPGRALDVGCGEGGDAIWLAQRGWQVTAVDISAVAVERARRAAEAIGVDVDWRVADVLAVPPAGPYDLVSVQYPALLAAAGRHAVRRLLDTVAPGGLLLAVGHDLDGHFRAQAHEHGFDPADYVDLDAIAALLPDDFVIETREVRERPHPPAGNPHVADVVLRARRR